MESTNKQCNIIEVINNNPNQYKYTGQGSVHYIICSFCKFIFHEKRILYNQFESKYDEGWNNIYYLCNECVKGVTIHMNPNIIPTIFRTWSFGPNNKEEQDKLNQNKLDNIKHEKDRIIIYEMLRRKYKWQFAQAIMEYIPIKRMPEQQIFIGRKEDGGERYNQDDYELEDNQDDGELEQPEFPLEYLEYNQNDGQYP